MKVLLRTAVASDYGVIHAINEAAVPAVSSITMTDLQELAEQCCDFKVAMADGQIAAFLMAIEQGQPYLSLNYLWFAKHYEKFVYIDRIVVSPKFKGKGIGRKLYANVEAMARKAGSVLTCEVNLIPRNADSLAFHRKLGFHEVGQQDIAAEKKRVSLLVKHL